MTRRYRCRNLAHLLIALGIHPTEIADITGYRPRTIRRWTRRTKA